MSEGYVNVNVPEGYRFLSLEEEAEMWRTIQETDWPELTIGKAFVIRNGVTVEVPTETIVEPDHETDWTDWDGGHYYAYCTCGWQESAGSASQARSSGEWHKTRAMWPELGADDD